MHIKNNTETRKHMAEAQGPIPMKEIKEQIRGE